MEADLVSQTKCFRNVFSVNWSQGCKLGFQFSVHTYLKTYTHCTSAHWVFPDFRNAHLALVRVNQVTLACLSLTLY